MRAITAAAARTLLWTAALALAGGALPLWLAAGDLPDIEIRTVPWRAHSGRLLARWPLAQGFRCETDGLRRIEVALVSLVRPSNGGVELTLRAGGPDGAALRTVEVRPGDLAQGGEWVAFDFEPVADSAGRDFWFELSPTADRRPGDHGAHVRYHGQVGHIGTWAGRVVPGPVVEGVLRAVKPLRPRPRAEGAPPVDEVPHPNLRAVAFAAQDVAPRLGEVKLELWREGDEGPPLRTVVLGPENEVRNGFLIFAFEPIADSRWTRYRYRLTLHDRAALIGDELGPTMLTFHGTEDGDGRLLGLARGGVVVGDRDLVFRAWGERDRARAFGLIRERAGWRLWLAAALWIAAVAIVVRLFLVAGPRGTGPGESGEAA